MIKKNLLVIGVVIALAVGAYFVIQNKDYSESPPAFRNLACGCITETEDAFSTFAKNCLDAQARLTVSIGDSNCRVIDKSCSGRCAKIYECSIAVSNGNIVTKDEWNTGNCKFPIQQTGL